jgi:hypothetical protein
VKGAGGLQAGGGATPAEEPEPARRAASRESPPSGSDYGRLSPFQAGSGAGRPGPVRAAVFLTGCVSPPKTIAIRASALV